MPLLVTIFGSLKSRAALQLEVLALRQQLAMITERDHKRLRVNSSQRWFWILLYRCWPDCLQTLHVFQPDTLVRWHRKGFHFTGVSNLAVLNRADLPLVMTFVNLFERCREIT